MSEDNNEALDFTSLLKLPMNTWVEPSQLPAGKHFYGKITSWELGRAGQKNTGFAQVNITPTDPGEDCTPEDVEGVDLSSIDVNTKFWITKNALFMFRRFASSLGFQETTPLDEVMEESRGCRVLFTGSYTEGRAGADGKPRKFYNIDSIVGA